MNKISAKRVGVDGAERDLTDIRDYLVGEIEDDIRNRLRALAGRLVLFSEQDVVNDLLGDLHDILTADAVELKRRVDDIDNNYQNVFSQKNDGHWSSTALGKALLEAFDYQDYRKNVLVEVARRLNVKTCPYCNMHYTLYANEKKKRYVSKLIRFQFDHFFDKMRYPMLSMSFYNLIPSCSVCNQGKSSRHLSLAYHPYASDIGSLFHFELTDPLGPYTSARVNDEVEINLVPEVGVNQQEFADYVKTFHLKSLYSRHGDVVQEVFDKAYEDPYYLNPGNFNFLSDRASDYLKRLWLGNYAKQEDIEKRPLAKFMQDMWRQAKGK